MIDHVTRRGSTLIEDAMELACTGWIAARDLVSGTSAWATTLPGDTRPPEADGQMLPVPLTPAQRIAALEAENRRLWATVERLARKQP